MITPGMGRHVPIFVETREGLKGIYDMRKSGIALKHNVIPKTYTKEDA